jgi:hypothetical protein
MAKRASKREPQQEDRPPSTQAETASTPRIPYDDFRAAQRDPKVKQFVEEAQAEDEALKKKGFIHF